MTPAAGKEAGRVSLGDIEERLRRLDGSVGEKVEVARTSLAQVAIVAAAVVVVGVYLLGRRRGRLRSTVVEIRRI